jgi:hypothetical protein
MISVELNDRAGVGPGMTQKNRSVPTDTMVAHVVYEDVAKAIAWLDRAFGFQEQLRYGDGPSGRRCTRAKR